MVVEARSPRPVRWIGSSGQDLRAFPKKVRGKVGFALYRAQQGKKHEAAKPLKGYGGGGRVLEAVEDYDRGSYRAVYTVQFSEAVYVLHVFQKKSKRGIATPGRDVALIKTRLREAARQHASIEE